MFLEETVPLQSMEKQSNSVNATTNATEEKVPSEETTTQKIESPSNDSNAPSLHVRVDSWRGDMNAFNRKPMSCYEKIKMAFMMLSGIVLVKLILVALAFLFAYLLSLPVTCCNKDLRKPLSCWRKPFQWCIYLTIRIVIFICGFYWISTKDMKQFRKAKPRVVVGNHHTAWDGFIFLWLAKGAVCSRIENRHVPLAGRIGDAMQIIWIDRANKNGRKAAIQQILDHVADENLPPLLIFPQGTCSAIGHLTTFKKGAFLSGVPVQPIAIDYSGNCSSDLSFLTNDFGNDSIGFELIYGMCQFINFCRCEFLDVHVPTEAEKTDPLEYAENVRQEMITVLGAVCTQHSLGDWIMLKHARRKSANFDTLKFVMEDITERLLFRTRTVTKLCTRFAELDTNGDGYIGFQEFCDAVGAGLDEKPMMNLFRLFDTKRYWNKDTMTGDLDVEAIKAQRLCFEDFLVGVSICFVDHMIRDAVNIMFFANARNGRTLNKSDVMTISERIQQWLSVMDNANNANEEKEKQQLEMYKANIERFINVIFAIEEEELDFDAFYDRVIEKDQGGVVQQYLQMSLVKRLGVELEAKDFIDQDKISLNVPGVGDLLSQTSSALKS